MNQDFSSEEIIIEPRGGLGVITLNRPQALNALTLDMIRQMSGILKLWERDARIQAVLFVGTGPRAFCSGGDIKNFHKLGMSYRRGDINLKVGSMFFAEEYALDRQIFHYPKPTVAFMDGITMGGGFGIAGNCTHRIATNKTLFAMPETGIGFYPDVGSVFHLLRAPKNLGRYLALTGARVGGKDMCIARLADYFMSSEKREELVQALEKSPKLKETIAELAALPAGDSVFEKSADKIDVLFRHREIPAILKALAEDGSPFALETLELIESRSPTSVMVTAEHLRRSQNQSFNEIIARDFVLTQRFLERTDFYEGIRAAVIDKDRAPRWDPAKLENVTPEEIESHFEPTGHNLADVALFSASDAGN